MINVNTEKLEISKSILLENYYKQIDQKINAIKIEYMVEWERDHYFDSTTLDLKLKKLEEERERLYEVFNNLSDDLIVLDLQQFIKAS